VAISSAMRQNLHFMAVSQESLEKRIRTIKHQISELGDLRPGALSQQYNICGNRNCRCKAAPPVKHGPYYQISFTRHGKSSSQFVREEDLDEVRQQLDNYRQLRQLVGGAIQPAPSRKTSAARRTQTAQITNSQINALPRRQILNPQLCVAPLQIKGWMSVETETS